MTSEATAGRAVSYALDAAGNVTALTYPSGLTVGRTIDALDRLAAIPGVASYGYRGPDLVAKKTVGALSGAVGYDGARRPLERGLGRRGRRSSREHGWSPRSLLTGQSRRSLNDTAFRMGHDKAGRLTSGATWELPEAPAPSRPAPRRSSTTRPRTSSRATAEHGGPPNRKPTVSDPATAPRRSTVCP